MDCYECTGYGDDYYWDEELGDFVCACFDCPNFMTEEGDEYYD
jgi:hypothetical protein